MQAITYRGMSSWALVAILWCAPAAADLKVDQLEQDVRDLKQELFRQQRRIDKLEGDLLRSNSMPRRRVDVPSPGIEEAAAEPTRAWLSAANWERVRTGMSESEVLEILGPPTTLRKSDDGAKATLFYALEIGTGSFLAGSVALANKQVVEIAKPALR